MNKQQKQLKRLAERHHLLNAPITVSERNMLRESKYAHLIDESNVKSKFNALFEQFTEGETTGVKSKERAIFGDPLVHRSTLRELLSDIEGDFSLCIASTSPTKFKSVDLDQLKQFIEKFSNEKVYDEATRSFINSLLQCDTTYRLMDSLYTMCVCK